MKNISPLRFVCFVVLVLLAPNIDAAEPIRRVLPPAGMEIPADARAGLEKRVQELGEKIAKLPNDASVVDCEVFRKAIDFALRHGEFYQAADVKRANELLDFASQRLKKLESGDSTWARQHGRIVRGFRSAIDGSVQPYGLVIPDDVNFDKPVPLYVWLHGRGDKQTDMPFIYERLNRDGQIKPAGAIVLHPFGRHCIGFKSAGEIDVFEAIEDVRKNYKIDPDRIVLMGFSMGGAGTWHIGAHYTDRFVAISAGAGFVETARYTRLKPEDYPASYEQTLWRVYDVPNYTRNLFNRPVIAYSGEMDKQIQAARVMEEAYQEHGQKLTHLIGPGMGHKYHPDTLQEILDRIAEAVKQGRPATPEKVSLQTTTLRYNRMDWAEALRLDQHWRDSRIDARLSNDGGLQVTTSNIRALRLTPRPASPISKLTIDDQVVMIPTSGQQQEIVLVRDSAWRLTDRTELDSALSKRPGLQGPIDDVFLEPFLVVTPSKKAADEKIQQWLDAELEHFQDRWRGVFRGELRIKSDQEVTESDIKNYHLVVWGTPDSNSVLNRALTKVNIPIGWKGESVVAGDAKYAAGSHMPAFIYPNPLNTAKYLVVNSGPTFREAHDRTNSMQNPKLPDWAIIDLSEPPSANAPGRIVAADFFDERWQMR